jgi:hypothetical protein
MPKVLYENVIEVSERVVPFLENDTSNVSSRIKTQQNGQKVIIFIEKNYLENIINQKKT